MSHKFRSSLRAHCKIRHEDYALVCVSGQTNSMAMLHMFNSTFNDNTSQRKLFFKLKVLYVDDSFLQYSSDTLSDNIENFLNNRKNIIENISQLCEKYGFPFDCICLENIYQINQLNDNSEPKNLSETNIDLCIQYLKMIESFRSI